MPEDYNMIYVKVESIAFENSNPVVVIKLEVDEADLHKMPRFAARHLGAWVHLDFDENRAYWGNND